MVVRVCVCVCVACVYVCVCVACVYVRVPHTSRTRMCSHGETVSSHAASGLTGEGERGEGCRRKKMYYSSEASREIQAK